MFSTHSVRHTGATLRCRGWCLWFVSLLGLLAGGSVMAGPATPFTGHWQLLERQSVSGVDYANGVPQTITIEDRSSASQPDDLWIEQKSTGPNDTLTTRTNDYVAGVSAPENLSDHRRSSRIERQADAREWIEHVTIDPIPASSSSHRDITITWTLSGDGKTLTVVRDDKDVTKGEAFVMKGTYFKPTPVADGSVPGIHFESGLSWADVLAKAKAEHKPIFVDAYATWCRPCKEMDDHVYPLEPVGDFFNAHFISVRMQIDQTPKDSAEVKAGYADAAKLSSSYAITGFPTFLFFDPDGTPIHKAAGGMGGVSLIALGQDALTPTKQYYTQIRQFKAGVQLPLNQLTPLALALRDEHDPLAGDVAVDYLKRASATELSSPETVKLIGELAESDRVASVVLASLDAVPDRQLLEPRNLELISQFRHTKIAQRAAKRCLAKLTTDEKFTEPGITMMDSSLSEDSGPEFEAFRDHAAQIDAVMKHPGYSGIVVNYWIHSTDDRISKAEMPAWTKMSGSVPDFKAIHARIAQKYDAIHADRVVLAAQAKWYGDHEQWPQYCKYKVALGNRFGIKDANGIMDEVAWDVFTHCTVKSELIAAASWMAPTVMNAEHPEEGSIDTYANLLYRAGEKERAVSWEQKAVTIEAEKAHKDKGEPDPIFALRLDKMRKGQPTWPTS